MNRVRRVVGTAVAAACIAAATIGFAGTPASAKTVAKYVAIVVGGVGVACVPWTQNMTGAQVLSTRFDPLYGGSTPRGNYSGMVIQINGKPSSPDPQSAYWTYFHNTGSGWEYSGTGALSFEPAPGTVEGWEYNSASTNSSTAKRPPNYGFASICAGQDPTAAPKSSSKPASTRSSAHAAAHSPARSARAAATRDPSSHTPTPSARSTAEHTLNHSSGPVASTRASPSPTPTASIALANELPTAPPKANKPSESGVPTWTTAVAIAFVLALGGAGFWRARTGRGR